MFFCRQHNVYNVYMYMLWPSSNWSEVFSVCGHVQKQRTEAIISPTEIKFAIDG